MLKEKSQLIQGECTVILKNIVTGSERTTQGKYNEKLKTVFCIYSSNENILGYNQ